MLSQLLMKETSEHAHKIVVSTMSSCHKNNIDQKII